MNSPAKTASAREVIRGGRDVTIKLHPKTVDEALAAEAQSDLPLEELKIFVRKVPFLEVDTTLLPAFGSNKKELLVYLGEHATLLDRITDESQIEVLKVGRELNFFMLKECLALQQQTLDASGQSEAVKAMVEKALSEVMAAKKP